MWFGRKKARGCGLVVSLKTYYGGNMHYDPIHLGAMLAFVINAWLASRRGR